MKGVTMGYSRLTTGNGNRLWKYLLAAFCIAALSTGVAACGGDSSDGTSAAADTGSSTTADTGSGGEASGDPIVIGAAVAATGWLEPYDASAKVMEQFAIEDINAEGGVLGRPLELVSADSKSEQAAGSTAALEVIEQGAEMVIVSCDFDFGSPAALVAQENDLVAFSTCAGSPKFGVQAIGPNAYTMSNATPALAATMAEFAYEAKDFRNAYILLDDTIDYTKTLCAGFEEAWTKLGGKIAGKDIYKNEDASVASQITRLKSTPNVDFIFQCSYNPGAAQVLRQLRNSGVDLPVLASESQDGDYWLNAVPDLSEFYYQTYGSIFGDDPRPEINELVKRYTEKTGEPPAQALAFTGYSVIEAYAKAVEDAGTTETAAVVDALNSFDNVELVVGETTFTPDLHINLHRPMAIMEIQNGKNQFVELRAPKTLPKVEF